MSTTGIAVRVAEDQPPVGDPVRRSPAPRSKHAIIHAAVRRAVRGRAAWFYVPAAAYLVVAVLLVFRYGSIAGDAPARVANAYYMLYSRDPHMAAVGFVWNPLPSFTVLPLLAISHLWWPLSQRAFAGNVMSALFMAGAVYEMRAILADLDVPAAPSWVLTASFGLHPLVLYYAGNGMTEGLFLFTLLGATRGLTAYLRSNEVGALVRSGMWLAMAYYARNEAAASIVIAAPVVALVAWRRARGPRVDRIRQAATDVFIFGLPPAFAVITWAVASWLIVGHPFEQFTSQYGNSSQLRVLEASGGLLRPSFGLSLKLAFFMAPASLLLVIPVLLRAAWQRSTRSLGAVAVLGGSLLFSIVGFAFGKTAGWFRYFIPAAAFAPLLCGCLMTRTRRWTRRDPAAWTVASVVLSLAAAATSALACADLVFSQPNLSREDFSHLVPIFDAKARIHYPRYLPGMDEAFYRYKSSHTIAVALDHLHGANGSIIVDTFTPCVPTLVLASRHPQEFVITNDRDFRPVLADPVAYRAGYFLVPDPTGTGALDEINRTYPDLFAHGAGMATLRREFALPGCPRLRLYQVLPG